LLVAHSDAEEKHFYSHVEKLPGAREELGSGGASHEANEHTMALLALQTLMEDPDARTKEWETKLAALEKLVFHHIGGEERKVHNLARREMSAEQRTQLGAAFSQARDAGIAARVGSLDHVRELVKERATLIQKLKDAVVG